MSPAFYCLIIIRYGELLILVPEMSQIWIPFQLVLVLINRLVSGSAGIVQSNRDKMTKGQAVVD